MTEKEAPTAVVIFCGGDGGGGAAISYLVRLLDTAFILKSDIKCNFMLFKI